MIDASNQGQLEADLELSIRSVGSKYSKMTWKDAFAHLDGKERGWLLFLDNADSLDLDLRPYLPRSEHGAILITTRNRGCVSYALDGAVPVGNLEESEAVTLLHMTADYAPSSDYKSLEIVRELGMLAVAITQAGAYIRKTRRLDMYLDTFRRHRDQLLRKQPERGSEYTSSTYTAFDLSFQQLPAETQELMKIFASLHHLHIPIALFEKAVESGFAADTVQSSTPPPESDDAFISILVQIFGVEWNQVSFQEIVDSASRASLVNVSTDGLSYSVNPLVQTYIKDNLGEEETQHYVRITAQLLLGAIRPPENGNAWYWQLLPHVNCIPRSVQSENVAHALVFLNLYESLGDRMPCRELSELAISKLLATRGQGDRDSLLLMTKLAKALQDCGQPAEAVKKLQEVLAVRLETLGPRSADTVTTMNNLALALRGCGQLDEAERMQREVLALRFEIFGSWNPDTIAAMNNLALTLADRGQLDEAEMLQREALAPGLETVGKGNSNTILAMSNLSVTLRECGRLDEAEEMGRDALALRLEILGPRHPDTIMSMDNLGHILFTRGQLDEAEKLQREVLALRLEITGPKHLDTILAMGILAKTLRTHGQLDEAERMQREVLALQLEIVGPRHLDTITTKNNLALLLYPLGHSDEAERMQREVLALRLEILGREDLRTLRASFNLSMALYAVHGNFEEAAELLQEAVPLYVKLLGECHPDTRSSKELFELVVSKQSYR